MSTFTPISDVHNKIITDNEFLFIKGVITTENMFAIADSVFGAGNNVVVVRESDESTVLSMDDVNNFRIDFKDESWLPEVNSLRVSVVKALHGFGRDKFFRYELKVEEGVVLADSENSVDGVDKLVFTPVSVSSTILAPRNNEYKIDRAFAALEVSNILRFANTESDVDNNSLSGVDKVA